MSSGHLPVQRNSSHNAMLYNHPGLIEVCIFERFDLVLFKGLFTPLKPQLIASSGAKILSFSYIDSRRYLLTDLRC